VKNNKAIALMEFIPHQKNKLRLNEILDVIYEFHKETENVQSNIFITYDFNAFYKELVMIRTYLPPILKSQTKKQLKEFFAEIFDSKYSIIHGDFHEDQIIKNKNYYLIDFISSFYGPKILDYAYIFKYDKKIKKQVLICSAGEKKIPNKEMVSKFLKSLVIILISDIFWCVNRRKYEHKSFATQILKANRAINRNMAAIIDTISN